MTFPELTAAVATFHLPANQTLTARPMNAYPGKPATIASVRLVVKIPVPGSEEFDVFSADRAEPLDRIDDARLYKMVKSMVIETAAAEFAWRNPRSLEARGWREFGE